MFASNISRLPLHVKKDGHQHSVQFYAHDSTLLNHLSRYVGSALGRGDSAVVIATQSHSDELRERLQTYGFDTSYPRLKRRYIELDAEETLSQFMVKGSPDPVSFSQIMSHVLIKARVSAEGAPPGVVAFGEMVSLLWQQGNSESALRLEHIWNDLAYTNSFSLHCAYPQSIFTPGDEDEFLKICAEHSQVTFSPDHPEPIQ